MTVHDSTFLQKPELKAKPNSRQIWTQTLFKRSAMFGSGSLAQRTTNFSVTVTGTAQKFPRQTPSSYNKKQACLPWHNTKLPAVLKEKLFCSNSPPQINLACSRHTCTQVTCRLRRAAHATVSLLVPSAQLIQVYEPHQSSNGEPHEQECDVCILLSYYGCDAMS